ncbi:metallophosphoesterase [Limosilactobacillus fastidiosus]|uniref:Phosphoesterase n=1 Tax=Limosilactobacillus fastidiosus TaxID=2759855 RepID=A0A7W3TYL6_9LACO|nr:metallophosphoesterase [Limosilactobacillus fastidiosus]MBB1063100.1 metallophosphoesterase [Limosilactobacillus fastidiosus]MBB1085647.1 metallophosphoesterase [Limosilactobacillus fastidiosus]MCD7083819.1 metallophosphoesterase [Limosilactobacillus fastidiosus]MCD7086126.1 metallophosphoesterase [Limosilactobacillus fastidiosus]MCD7113987.1 metallophosphoesterase [Limosilactobacillus fastidiosus]
MKALIVSDNHGDDKVLEAVQEKFANQVDVLIHCGDSELQNNSETMAGFKTVKGNNDWGLDYPVQLQLIVDGVKFLVVHGDHDKVNYSLTPLMLKAESLDEQVVCYGHTHQLAVSMESGILFINPGSISLPRGEYSRIGGTLAIIEVTEQQFIIDYYNRNCVPIPELHFEFNRS